MPDAVPLRIEKDHLVATVDGFDWLVDTGAPATFGRGGSLNLNGSVYAVPDDYMGLTADQLSDLVGFPTVGILGVDVLNHFDLVFDLEHQALILSTDEVPPFGILIPTEEFLGIPIIEVNLQDHPEAMRMFLDTGAKISYIPVESLEAFPQNGEVEDFYPGFGQFRTVTHSVTLSVSSHTYATTAGALPTLLNMTLMLSGVDGILGNEILKHRTVGYFPRRNLLCL